MRVGQKNGQVYQWAKKGSRPRQPKHQRYENAYLFGAVCAARGTGAARLARTQCARKCLAVYAPDLSLQPRLRKLRRHPRRLPARLAKASRGKTAASNPSQHWLGSKWVSLNELWYNLNVTKSLVSQWERGEKHPRGASLKLLALIEKKGLDAEA